MQFSTLLIAAFASAAAAQDSAGYSAAYSSYIAALQTNPGFIQSVIALSADTALFSTLEQIATQVPDPKQLTGTPAFFSELPSSLVPLFDSIYSAEVSIAKQYGVLASASTTGPASTKGASSTAAAGGGVVSTGIPFANGTGFTSSGPSGAASTGAGSTTASGSTATHTGAAASAGVAAMGLAAGVIGGLAVLL